MTQPRVKLAISGPSDLNQRWYPNGLLGGLNLPGKAPGSVGTRCLLSVTDPKSRVFEVLGQIAWIRPEDDALPPAFGVDFVEDDASLKRLMLFAQGKSRTVKGSGASRLFTNLPVQITFNGRPRDEKLFDLSEGGAFIQTREPLVPGSFLEFTFRSAPVKKEIRISGRVAWARTKGSPAGMGVQFLFDDQAQAEEIRKIVRALITES